MTSIGDFAFYECSALTSVTIGNSVTSIGHKAFCNCRALTDIYCYAESVPTTGVNVFSDSPVSSATLHVPAASLETYKTTSPWTEFGTIVALTEEETAVKGIKQNADGLPDGKYMKNGKIIIIKKDKKYDATGRH